MKKLTLILLCSMLLSFTLPGCVVTDENGNTFMFLPDLDIDDGPHGPPPPPPSRHGHHLHHTMNQDMVQAHVVHTVHMVGKKNRHSKFMNF